MPVTKTLPKLRIRDFSGHLNLRDAQLELGPTESPDEWNVTGDERGSVAKRLGYAKWNTAAAYNASLTKNGFYWSSSRKLIVQSGTQLFLDLTSTVRKTFSTADRVGFADFLGLVWVIHPVDGMFSSADGITYTAVPAGPLGSTLAVWQNQLWAAGLTSRVYYSMPGSGTQWYDAQTTSTGVQVLPLTPFNAADTSQFDATGAFTVNGQVVAYTGKTATSFTGCTGGAGSIPASSIVHQGDRFNNLREKDDEAVVCLTGASGVDIQGRPGLLAFKKRSTYRIYDSDTAAYQTVDSVVGAASGLATSTFGNETYVVSERGLYFTDGVSKLLPVGDREEPLWRDTQIAYDQLDLVCAGRVGDRIKFSLPRTGMTRNDLAFEYHPSQKWLIPGSNAMSFYTTYGSSAEKLLGGSPTVVGQVYQLDTGGSDDGAAIRSWYQTKFFEPAEGLLARLRHLAVIGRGAFSLYARFDYDLANDEIMAVDITTNLGAVYDDASSVYDDGISVYGPTKAQDYQMFNSLGCAKAVSFRIEETSSIVTTGPQLLGGGTASQVGAWALYGLDLSFVPLGDV